MNPWHRLKRAIEQSGLPAADRQVYSDLLDHGRDYVTARPQPEHAPSFDAIAKRTGRSRRQVAYSLRHLERHGWIKVTGHVGRQHRNVYKLAAGDLCDCTGRRHVRVAVQPDTPVAVQPDTSVAVQPLHCDGVQRGSATQQLRGRVPTECFLSIPPTGTTDKQGSPQNGDPVTCRFCGAEGIVGVRLIDHDPGCPWLAAVALLDAER